MRIIEQGRTDAVDSTSLHVPSIGLVVGGDVLYNECHMYIGDTTPESRENWIAALDRLAALNPKIAVAGHKKTGTPDTPAAIEASKRYLTDFSRLQKSASVGVIRFGGQVHYATNFKLTSPQILDGFMFLGDFTQSPRGRAGRFLRRASSLRAVRLNRNPSPNG